jgi:hypothetical protein
MSMNIMPILCRRRSAGISHNIAPERQASIRAFFGNNLIYPALHARLKAVAEFKFVTAKAEAKTALDHIYTDMMSYRGSSD